MRSTRKEIKRNIKLDKKQKLSDKNVRKIKGGGVTAIELATKFKKRLPKTR